LGWRAIVRELGLAVSYRTVARWYEKYSHFINGVKVTHNPSTAVTSDSNLLSLEPVNRWDLDVIKKQWGRLGRTQRAVLSVILTDPSIVWTAAAVHRRLRLLKYVVSRQAVYMAMRRLVKRGLLHHFRQYLLVEGEVIKGGFKLVAFGPSSFAVHNLRIPRLQVISNDAGVNLSSALFTGSITFGEVPITQMELNSDIPLPKEILNYLRNLGWGFSIIYPKPKLGVLRVEHRLWPKDLTLSLKSKEEIERRGKLITSILYDILSYEVSRLRTDSSDRRGILRAVPSVL
jgi:hypothetical protein